MIPGVVCRPERGHNGWRRRRLLGHEQLFDRRTRVHRRPIRFPVDAVRALEAALVLPEDHARARHLAEQLGAEPDSPLIWSLAGAALCPGLRSAYEYRERLRAPAGL